MDAPDIPTVTVPELIRNPNGYFDREIRVQAVLRQHLEGKYLAGTGGPMEGDLAVGVAFADPGWIEREALRRGLIEFAAREYGGQAEVVVWGVLRNRSAQGFYPFRWLFEISAFESIRPLIART